MVTSNVNLAALIGSRICHDLISPIGAINNGIELLGMTGATDGPEVELISESVGNASARIRFFRIAFGAAGDQLIGRSEATGVLDDLMGNGRLHVDYSLLEAQPRKMVRLAFLGILCLESAMPYGGQISVSCMDGQWTLRGTADKLNIDMTLWSVLADPGAADDIAPANVQFALLPVLAADESVRPLCRHHGPACRNKVRQVELCLIRRS